MSRTSRTSRLATGRRLAVAVVLLATFVAILLLNGILTAEAGSDAEGRTHRGPDGAVPVAVREGGSAIDSIHDPVRNLGYPTKSIALTFDDGPDPTWTPQILDVLAKYDVPGTFFVLGSLAAQHPGLVREIRGSGSEVGLHTFTHPDLGEVAPSTLDRELSLTQLALAGSTGEISYLVRPPYSSRSDALTDADYGVVTALGQRGYVTALTDFDSRDWERKGAEAIERAATPESDAGGALLLHDAGGDRSQTVAALDRLIPRLQAQGWRFTTVSEGLGLPPANTAANLSDVVFGRILVSAAWVATHTVRILELALLLIGVLVLLRLVLLVVVARRHARRSRRATRDATGPWYTAPVSVVVPAYNEKECIEATVRSLVASDHPVEIIVVDDGSTDGTADIVERLALPRVRVIRRTNGGKPAALNTGIRAARHDVVVMIDGDTVFEPSTVGTLVQPFVRPEVGAVAGNAKVANRGSLVSRWQHIEYVMGFNLDRRVYDEWRCMATVPGAVGAFRRSALLEVGGVSDDTLAEDTDLTMALCRAGWRVVYEERARAWTEAPASIGQLWQQRYRWSYGTVQSMWKHRGSVFDRGPAGHFGRVGLLHIALFQVALPLLAPLVDVFLVYGLLFLNPWTTLAAWAGVQLVQLVAAWFAFRLEGERAAVLWLLPLQQIVYRQLMYLVLIQSIATAASGIRLRWQKLRRTGDFGGAPAGTGVPLVPEREPVSATTGGAGGPGLRQ